jgi:hypothetical protein
MKYKDLTIGLVVAIDRGVHREAVGSNRTPRDLRKGTIMSLDRYGRYHGLARTTPGGTLIKIQFEGWEDVANLAQIRGPWEETNAPNEAEIAILVGRRERVQGEDERRKEALTTLKEKFEGLGLTSTFDKGYRPFYLCFSEEAAAKLLALLSEDSAKPCPQCGVFVAQPDLCEGCFLDSTLG